MLHDILIMIRVRGDFMRERTIRTGQVIWIVILSLLLIGNIAYITYDKVYLGKQEEKQDDATEKKKSLQKSKVKKEKITRSLSLAEEKMLLSQIEYYNMYLSTSYPIEDVKQLENGKKLLFAYAMLEDRRGQKEFMQGELKKQIDAYFGMDSQIVYEDILCDHGDGVLYQYNNATKVFQLEGVHGHEGMEYYASTSFFVNGTVFNDKEYEVVVQTIYHRYCGGTCGPLLNYYKSADDAKNEKNPVITREEERELTENDYEKVKDQLDKIVFKFYKDRSGNYGLVSVKKDTAKN